jgi:hypothetical protein
MHSYNFNIYNRMDKTDQKMNKMVKRWEMWLVAIVPALIVGFILMAFTNKHESNKSLIEKVDKKVDKSEMIEYVDKQDFQIIQQIKTHISDDDKRNEILMQYLKSIDNKTDVLIQKSK